MALTPKSVDLAGLKWVCTEYGEEDDQEDEEEHSGGDHCSISLQPAHLQGGGGLWCLVLRFMVYGLWFMFFWRIVIVY